MKEQCLFEDHVDSKDLDCRTQAHSYEVLPYPYGSREVR